MIKKISVREFRDEGFLQELNRNFLHPLGLALEVVIDDDNKVTFGEVWDYRDDPEGLMYSQGDIDSEFRRKAKNVKTLAESKAQHRQSKLGWVIQPVSASNNDSAQPTQTDDAYPYCTCVLADHPITNPNCGICGKPRRQQEGEA